MWRFSRTTASWCPCRCEKSWSPASTCLEAKASCDRAAQKCVRRPISGFQRPPDSASIVELPHHRLWRHHSPCAKKVRRPWVVNLNAIQRAMCDTGNPCAQPKGARPQGARAGSYRGRGRGRGGSGGRGRRRVWRGRAQMRAVLTVAVDRPGRWGPPSIPATVAVRHNPALRDFFRRLVAADKARKLGLTAGGMSAQR